ncbi:AAA family ATPase [Thalassolituus oleivorans]|nr:MoxR family ATPase [Thalassolituus oleivorans]
MRLSLGYPDAEQELAMMMAQMSGHPLDELKPVLSESLLLALIAQIEKVVISEPTARYISELVRATREHAAVRLGASPRGSLALMRAARAIAALDGKKAVTVDIVKSLLEPVLSHRLVFRDSSLMQPEKRKAFWNALIAQVPVPDYPTDDLV